MSEKKPEYRSNIIKYSVIIVLIVASVAAGILIALKLHRSVAPKNKETRGRFSTTCFLVFYCSSFLGTSFFFALNAGLSIMLRPMVTNM